MEILWLVLKGMLMGISNIIPGVSGGTMAVSLGIYDDLIFSITRLFKEKKKSIKFLLPLGMGLALGVIFFSYAIEFLLAEYAFITSLAFIGLILGGLPILNQKFQDALKEKSEKISLKNCFVFFLFFVFVIGFFLAYYVFISSLAFIGLILGGLPILNQKFQDALKEKSEKISLKHCFVFILFLGLVIGFSLIQESSMNGVLLQFSFETVSILFVLGIIASSTMIIPGVSGSLVLMIFGYYYPLIQLLTSFFHNVLVLNWSGLGEDLLLIFPVGLGIIFGVFLISKLIEFLFIKFPSITYSGILGLVIASPFAILYNVNAFEDLAQSNTILTLIIGSILLCTSSYIT